MNAQNTDAMALPAAAFAAPAVAAKGNLVKKIAIGIVLLLVLIQALYVVQAQPGELITGLNGMANHPRPLGAAQRLEPAAAAYGRRSRPSISAFSARSSR